MEKDLLRQIPKVDELTQAARQVIDELRSAIQKGEAEAIPSVENLAKETVKRYEENQKPSLRRVINGTGIILHTNLGRAPLAEEAIEAAREAACGYSNLEYDVNIGTRSNRHVHVEGLLMQITGAEAAMAVNNNAAAVLLALSAVAKGRKVIISRGELVEIGGSFRIPDVLEQSGCRLLEVGTTNKTHLADYERALCEQEEGQAGAILRVHASNFKIVGFTSAPSIEELSSLAAKNEIPLIEDLGSGDLNPPKADIVCFSGDKLLGGPQAGIVIGKAKYISKMKSHPLARAMRIDKMSLAALEATLRLYLNQQDAAEKIPVQRMLHTAPGALRAKALRLQSLLNTGEIVAEQGQAGGGAMPEEGLVSYAVALPVFCENHFRSGAVPIIGRISKGRFLLDVRCIEETDFPLIAKRFEEFSQ